MGTPTIIEYGSVGSQANRDTDVADLGTCLKTTVDASTSGTVESVTLNPGTRIVSVVGDAEHRISVKSTDCTDNYDIVGTTKESFGATGTLYYRTN